MSHHTDLAEKGTNKAQKDRNCNYYLFFFSMYSLKSIFQSSIQHYAQVEVVEAKGNTFALIQ